MYSPNSANLSFCYSQVGIFFFFKKRTIGIKTFNHKIFVLKCPTKKLSAQRKIQTSIHTCTHIEVLTKISHIYLFIVDGENLFQSEPFWKTVLQTLFSLNVTELFFDFLQEFECSIIKFFTTNGTTPNLIKLKKTTVLPEIENWFPDFYYLPFQTP